MGVDFMWFTLTKPGYSAAFLPTLLLWKVINFIGNVAKEDEAALEYYVTRCFDVTFTGLDLSTFSYTYA